MEIMTVLSILLVSMNLVAVVLRMVLMIAQFMRNRKD
jgi:hypothetical protein